MSDTTLPDVVLPTTGRPSLGVLLRALAGYPGRVVVVDDRRSRSDSGPLGGLGSERDVLVLRSGGRGPAAARNVGWRACSSPWVTFLDDDVVPTLGWADALADDLDGLPWRVVASQGGVQVPLPADRRPTDWERNVAGLEGARWATADMAVRRVALEAVGGFDERFPRAYREDADLGLRLEARGLELVQGARRVTHPVAPAPRSVSVAKQRQNADDALMDALHGPDWRARAGAPRGRFARHAAVSAAGAVALGAAVVAHAVPPVPVPGGRAVQRAVRQGGRRLGALAGAGWLAGTAELAWARIAPGPRTRGEVMTMLWTSAVLPLAATVQRLRGLPRARRLAAAAPGTGGAPLPARPTAVLLDRDDTLVHDVPYNGDPALVLARPGVRRALDALRAAGLPLAVVSNQSGIARGLLTQAQVGAVMDRVAEQLGPFDDVRWCPHAPEDGCGCRKPEPGLLLDAAAALGADPRTCAMVGDIGADVEAARAAGMRGILVPTDRTRPGEVAAAAEVAPTFAAAVDRLLAGAPFTPRAGSDPAEAHDATRARPARAVA